MHRQGVGCMGESFRIGEKFYRMGLVVEGGAAIVRLRLHDSFVRGVTSSLRLEM